MRILREDFGDEFVIPHNFEKTAPPHEPPTPGAGTPRNQQAPPPKMHSNPQTTLMCEMLGITDPTSFFLGRKGELNLDVSDIREASSEMDAGDDVVSDDDVMDSTCDATMDSTLGESFTGATPESSSARKQSVPVVNPAQISLDSESEDEEENNPESTATGTNSGLNLPAPRLSGLNLPQPTNTDVFEDKENNEDDDTKTMAQVGSVVEGEEQQIEKAETPAESNLDDTASVAVKHTANLSSDGAPVTADQSAANPTPGEESVSSAARPPAKKFKRRNQSLYENTE